MGKKKKSEGIEVQRLNAGPDVTRFQEYAHDLYLGGNRPQLDSYSQRPRVTLQDFLANRIEKVMREIRDEEEA